MPICEQILAVPPLAQVVSNPSITQELRLTAAATGTTAKDAVVGSQDCQPSQSAADFIEPRIGMQIAAKAEEWIDVPFRWQGTVRAGCDCKGLVAGVARELGRPEADSVEALAGDYASKVDVKRLKAGLARMFDPVTELQPGDLLLCKMGGAAQHLAICAPKDGKPNRVIEAMPHGPGKVRPAHWPDHRVDSIWRWRD